MSTQTYLRIVSQQNYLINGNFDFWQRGTSAITIGTTNTYRSDRFYALNSTAGTATIGRSTDVPTLAQSGVTSLYSAEIAVTVTTTPTAAQRIYFAQGIEGYFFQKLLGNTVTVSFWQKAHVAGTYPVSLLGVASTSRSYVSTYTVTAVNTWTKYNVTFTISEPGTTFGSDFNVGAYLIFGLSHGSNYQTSTLNSWITGDLESTSSAANAMSALGSVKFAQIILNIGFTPASFNTSGRTPITELMACQRYFASTYPMGTPPGSISAGTPPGGITISVGAGSVIVVWKYPVTMRAAPTTIIYNAASGTVGTWRDASAIDRTMSIFSISDNTISVQNNGTVKASTSISGHITVDSDY